MPSRASTSRAWSTVRPPLFYIYADFTDDDGCYNSILGLQHPSGVFAGDAFGETDTRFLYCAVSALSLLGALDRLDRERTVSYLVSCRNFDGGFGRIAGSESHAAQGMSLSPTHSPHTLRAGAPLSSDFFSSFYYYYYIPFSCRVGVHRCARDSRSIRRGRPADVWMVASGKTAAQRRYERATRKTRRCVHILIYLHNFFCCGDGPSRANRASPFPIQTEFYRCYSPWVLSSMAVLNKLTWIDRAALTRFILSAQVRERMLRLLVIFVVSGMKLSIYLLLGPRGWRNCGPAG